MKAWFSLWLAMLVSLLVGCAAFGFNEPRLGRYDYTRNESAHAAAPIRVIPIWIDKNFGAADRIAIDDAVNAWNYAMNGYVVLKVVDTQFDMEIPKIVESVRTGGWLFMRINHDNAMVPSTDKGFWTIGFTERISGHHLYLVRDRLGNDDVFGVTLHEIGHLMGSDHVGKRLMYPHYTRARFQCVDYDTMIAVSNAWDLQIDNLNYCVDREAGSVVDKDKKPEEEVAPDGGPVLSNCPVIKR
jgi:hypothetical protein